MTRIKTNIMAAALLTSTSLACITVAPVAFAEASTNWSPISTEKLVKMPSAYIEKAVERDFNDSGLAQELYTTNDGLRSKTQTIRDIKEALVTAEGKLLVELKHQYLVEKSNMLDLMEQQHVFRETELRQKIEVYENLAKKLRREAKVANDPVTLQLKANRDAARARLEQTLTLAEDSALQNLPGASQSKYSKEYAENNAAIQALAHAVRTHEANALPEYEGQTVSREEFVRQMINEAEVGLALLKQETEMRSLMARKLALDAQALEQKLAFASFGEGFNERTDPARTANAVDLFID